MLTQRSTLNKIWLKASQANILDYEMLYPGTTTYHRSVAVEISSTIDAEILRASLYKVVERHEILRSRLDKNERERIFQPIDIKDINRDQEGSLKVIDASNIRYIPKIEALRDTLKKINEAAFLDEPFKLEQGPLWRCALIKFTENKYQFVMLFHHIIIDESSIGIIFNDLSAYYNAIKKEETISLPPLPSLSEININLSPEESKQRLDYWKKKLKNLPVLNLPTTPSPQSSSSFTGKRVPFHLDHTLIKQFMAQPALKGFSINQIMLASFYILLNRYSSETDICIGITSANRRHDNINEEVMNQLVNCFFNSIPLRLSSSKNPSFIELLAEIKITQSEALKKQLPLDEILKKALEAPSISRLQNASPYSVMLVLNRKKPTLTFNDIEASYPVELDFGRCKFSHFGFNFDELYDGSYQCFIEYNTALFHATTIYRLINHFKNILSYLAKHAECSISSIPILLAEEKLLINKFNLTHKDFSDLALVPDFLHQIAETSPDTPAIIFHDADKITTLTYTELDEQSTQLANYLIQQLPQSKDKHIGICLSRSPRLIITFYAIFKAGMIAVPLEANDEKACAFKAKDANLQFVITDHSTTHFFHTEFININIEAKFDDIMQCSNHYTSMIQAANIAYREYTSGTSDQHPKGIELSHGSLANLLYALSNQFQPGCQILFTALPTFDAWFFDLLVALITKGTLHLTNDHDRINIPTLEAIINEHNINLFVTLPGILNKFKFDTLLKLTHIISMGSSPDAALFDRLLEAGILIQNGYGPTETCVALSLQSYHSGNDIRSIGTPFANMVYYILDDEYRICPIGIPGELFIAGPQLGHYTNSELDQKKFLEMVFDPDANCFKKYTESSLTLPNKILRLYRTGDITAYCLTAEKNLNVIFLGRKDSELKLHGVRINLECISKALESHPSIKNAAVMLLHQEYLIAHIVTESATTLSSSTLRQYLREKGIPAIACPSRYIAHLKLPLTNNGKIDRLALATLSEVGKQTRSESDSTLTPLQLKLRSIWAEVLGCEAGDIDVFHTLFSELGGNSISIIIIAKKISEELKLSAKNISAVIKILNANTSISVIERKLVALQHEYRPALTVSAQHAPGRRKTKNNSTPLTVFAKPAIERRDKFKRNKSLTTDSTSVLSSTLFKQAPSTSSNHPPECLRSAPMSGELMSQENGNNGPKNPDKKSFILHN